MAMLTRCLFWMTLCLGLVVVMAGNASAHRAGEGYIYLDIGEDRIGGRFEMLATDLLAKPFCQYKPL